MNKIGWQFPKTNWGSEQGKNDPGLETFRGNPYPALAREPIQNSLDAHDKSDNPVRVEFSVSKLKKNQFPNREEYIKVLEYCIAEAKDGSDTQKEMQKALHIIEQDEIYFMKVSDFNTVGLSGSDQLRNTNWHRLIKVVGESEKEATSGGAFGIGKHAPFVCSDLKVVFYATQDIDGKQAFQGVAKLITFTDQDKEPCQATGFYGEKDKIQPIKNMSDVEDIFVRNETGTDLFVAGFDYRETWVQEIIEAVISSFFVAILEGILEVKVGEHLLNKHSLHEHIEALKEKELKANVINYYEVMTSENSTLFEEENFEGLGKIQLYLANKSTYNKKIAMVRKTGMLIKEKPNYQIPNKYAGVLLIKGDEFNRQLKRVENPTHTDWEYKRRKDVKVIRSALLKLNTWMNEKAKSLSPYFETESFDVDELSQFLPDENDESQIDTDLNDLEGVNGEPLESNLDKMKVKRKKKKTVVKISDWEDEGGDEQIVIEGDDDREVDLEPDTNPEPNPEPDPTKEKVQTARISTYKLFWDNQKKNHRLNLNVKKEGKLTISLEILGEDSDIPAIISRASIDGNILPVDKENIGPFNVSAGSNRIEFELTEKVRAKMGVSFSGK